MFVWKEMEPRASGVYLEPEFTDKFQSADLDFLGIGPPSPKVYSRRVPAPKPPQLSSPEAGSLIFSIFLLLCFVINFALQSWDDLILINTFPDWFW